MSIRKLTIYKKIGETLSLKNGAKLICVQTPDGLLPRQACEGCYFSAACTNQLQCGKFDREDRRFVWFQEIKPQNQ